MLPAFAPARILPLLLVLGCSASGVSPGDAGTVTRHPAMQKVFGGNRPVTLQVPASYDNNKPTPLLILLHGYSANAFEQTTYFGFDNLVNEAGVLFAAPDGLKNSQGNQFWNATDFCCDFEHTGVDDVGYITKLITDISTEYNVDPKRVYVTGHSNGGFMSYRLACEHPELIAAIVSLAGATWLDPAKCAPKQPVSVLQIHGTDDMVIAYNGLAPQNGMPGYPGALADIDDWRMYDHCSGMLQPPGETFDIGTMLTPSLVTPQQVAGCPAGINVDLWTIQHQGHIPALGDDFRARVWAWLAAHPKP